MSSISIDRSGFLANVLLARKGPCRVATTANITLSGEQTIDGVSVVANDRVLVKDQDDTKENGIWAVKTGAWERVQDMDQRGHVVQGTRVFVNSGTTNALTDWYVTTTGRPRPGFEAIAFSQLSASEISGLTPTSGYAIIGDGTTWTAVGFTQAGTGAVTRTWLNKNRWRVDAEDFGATGDGSTDDVAAIQAAIDHVNSVGGGEVRFEAAEYSISDAVVLKTGVRLVGKGSANTILKLATNANTPVVSTLNFSTLTGGDTNGGPTDFGFIGLTLDGNKANQSADASTLNGVSIYGLRYLIEDLQILDAKGNGFYSEWKVGAEGTGSSASMEATIRRLRIDTCGRHGFRFKGPHDSYGDGIIIIDASQEADDTYDGFLLESAGTGRWVNIHPWHRGATSNRMLSAARIESSGNEFITPLLEGGRQCLIQRGDRNTYKAAHIFAVFSSDPMAVIRGSHVLFEARIEDTTSEGAACLQIGEAGGGLFNSRLNVNCITGATNAVVITDDDGLNTGIIKTIGATNAYSGSWQDNSSVLILKPDGTYEDRGAHTHNGARTFTRAGVPVQTVNTTDSATVQGLRIDGDRATPADFDQVYASYHLSNAGGTQTEIARLSAQATAVSTGAESGRLVFVTVASGSLASRALLDASGFFPNSNGGMSLGVAGTAFSNMFLSTGAAINWANGDVTITHGSTNLVTLAGGDFAVGSAALSTSAVDGLLYIPSSTSGSTSAPIGTPTGRTGTVPMVYATGSNRLWVYNGAWRSVSLSS